MPTLNEALLDEKLSQLEAARAWSPRVISKLETFLRTADDYDLFRVNPLRYAADKNMAESEAIDLFLYGTKFGLFEMDWNLVCASCGHVVESFAELARLHAHYNCPSCYVESTAALDDYIQVAFSLAPTIRDNRFYHPEQLSAHDLYLKYYTSKDIRPNAPDGTPYPESLLSLTVFLDHLPQGQRVTVDAELQPGVLTLRDIQLNPQIAFGVDNQAGSDLHQIEVELRNEKSISLNHTVQPVTVSQGLFTRNIHQFSVVPQGKTRLTIENHLERSSPLWILNLPINQNEMPLEFTSLFSGKHLLTNQTFRNLFRSQTVASDEGIAIQDITLLFTDLKGSTAMYDEIGDPKAYFLVRQHFETLGRVIGEHQGSVVKTIGDAVMATFMTPQGALQAALEMLQELEAFNQTILQKLHLKIGIHRGHSIAVTLNERLDYFGQTVNIAARVQGLADADEIYLTQEVFSALAESNLLDQCEVLPQQTEVKGVSDKLAVYRVWRK